MPIYIYRISKPTWSHVAEGSLRAFKSRLHSLRQQEVPIGRGGLSTPPLLLLSEPGTVTGKAHSKEIRESVKRASPKRKRGTLEELIPPMSLGPNCGPP